MERHTKETKREEENGKHVGQTRSGKLIYRL